MHTQLFACVISILLSQSISVPADFLLAPGKAGRLEVGMLVDDLFPMFGRANVALVDRNLEGMFSPAMEIRAMRTTDVSLIASFGEGPCPGHRVSGIEVRDAKYRTREGIGVGSMLGDLRRRYQKIELGSAEGAYAWVPAIRMSFKLTDDSRRDSVRVESVWIPGDPVEVRKQHCPGRRQ
jgi:hypothetical protein